MKLYTEAQLHDICQSVASKCCANDIPMETIIDRCNQYGHSQVFIEDEPLQTIVKNDDFRYDYVEVHLKIDKIENVEHKFKKI